jgi:hypothetical protein
MVVTEMGPDRRAQKLAELVGAKSIERYKTDNEFVFVTALNSEKGGFSVSIVPHTGVATQSFFYDRCGNLTWSESRSAARNIRGISSYVGERQIPPNPCLADSILARLGSHNCLPIPASATQQ